MALWWKPGSSPERHFSMADFFRLLFRIQVLRGSGREGAAGACSSVSARRLRFVFSSWASGVFRGPQANKKGTDLLIGALVMADGGKGGI